MRISARANKCSSVYIFLYPTSVSAAAGGNFSINEGDRKGGNTDITSRELLVEQHFLNGIKIRVFSKASYLFFSSVIT